MTDDPDRRESVKLLIPIRKLERYVAVHLDLAASLKEPPLKLVIKVEFNCRAVVGMLDMHVGRPIDARFTVKAGAILRH
ncbi:MAG: hypothetical protein GY877_07800 [Hyphomicrobium sp.]|nr:hypothetical protein [Hyphomicrobium sp.]